MSPHRPVSVLVIGGSGRLGSQVVQALLSPDDHFVVSAVGRSSQVLVSGVRQTPNLKEALAAAEPRVIIDTAPGDGLQTRLEAVLEAPCPYVLGSTGYDSSLDSQVEALSRRAPVVLAPNFSAGIVTLSGILENLAPAIGSGMWAAHIVDRHHKHKRDRPSGTAAMLANIVWGKKARKSIESIREGEVVGEHEVILRGEGEELHLTHRVLERSVFARGAVLAAGFALNAEPGRWTMADVLQYHASEQ